ILSDLQLLVQTARREFERYNVMAFCLEAEKFVDDRLSNWYVRRNRRRFWKSEQGEDKLAAYQTLYTVLTTLTRLFAPVMPFLTDTMYHNLEDPGGSIHLGDFPAVDEKLIDAPLSTDMDALLRLVSLGSAARNSVKIKVRQPLAELKMQPASEGERRAVERFADQIMEELNIKKVTLHDPKLGNLLNVEVKPNMKTLGPKFGPQLKAVQTALAAADSVALAEKAQSGQSIELTLTDGSRVTLDSTDVVVQMKAPEGWAGLADRGTQVLLDARVTPVLAIEGKARELIRQLQEQRKKSNLEMEYRIELAIETDSPSLQRAFADHRDHICNETFVVNLRNNPGEGGNKVQVQIEGEGVTFWIRKVQ